MAAVRLLPVEARDRQRFMDLCLAYNLELNPRFEPSEDWRETYFEAATSHEAAELLWIVTDATVGFVLLGYDQHPFRPGFVVGQIFEYYVRPEYRGSGVATEAAEVALQYLRGKGCARIQLEVLEENERARRFWTALGFKKISARYVLYDGPSRTQAREPA